MSALASGQRSAGTARVPGSFRDPAGFLFYRDGVLYRQVDRSHAAAYEEAKSSGLYDSLVGSGRLIPHDEVDVPGAEPERAHRVLRPEKVAFISYPYEWCFGQLRDAALLTLDVQHAALDHGMSLRDASAYNVQFHRGRPVLIDTLSFEPLAGGRPWVAYRQFCQHFLAPLALMSLVDVRLAALLRSHLDGIPLDLAARLLPGRTKLRGGLLLHLHQHARSQQRHAETGASRASTGGSFGLQAFRGLVDSLRKTVARLDVQPEGSTWVDYYRGDSYTDEALAQKERVVAELVDRRRPGTVWDLGANTGRFARLAAERGASALAVEGDPVAVEAGWRHEADAPTGRLLHLVTDLANPAPALGWGHAERESLTARGPADLVLALALVHHLAIAGNVPLERIAAWFAELGRDLLVEFVPKRDPKVQVLLASREDVFERYSPAGFEAAFGSFLTLVERFEIGGSQRTLYHYRREV